MGTSTQGLAFWEPENARALPSFLKQLEGGMVENRFLDGLVTRLFYNQGTVGNLATGLASAPGNIPTPFLRSLEALSQANVLRAVIETAASMIVRDPDFKVQTAGSTWKVQRSARKLSQWTTGVNRKCRLAETTYQVFTDFCTNRVGGFKPLVEGGKIIVERARPDSIIYANHEGPDTKTIGQRHGIPRARLKALYPTDAAGNTIDWANTGFPKYVPDPTYLVSWVTPWVDMDLLEVYEGWHCSSGAGDPGRWVVCCGDTVLVDKEWKHEWPGLILCRWAGSYAGTAGTPLGEQLLPYQIQLQRMDRTITDAISKLAIGRVWLQKIGAQLALTDRPADVSYYPGQRPPVIEPGIAIGREYYDRRALLRAEAFELAGVSIAQASGAKEAGLTAGVALRENNEQAYSRLRFQAETLDRALEQVAYAEIALADEHFSKSGYKVAAPGTRLLSEIDWKDFDVKEMGEYELQARTMRSLPNHPSARAEMLQEWVKMGQLDPKRVIKLMGSRDLESIEDEASVAEELAEMQISKAIDEAEFVSPEPYQGDALGILVSRGQSAYLKGVFGKAPPENLECLRRVIETARPMMSLPPGPVGPPVLPPPAPVAAQLPPAPMVPPPPLPLDQAAPAP